MQHMLGRLLDAAIADASFTDVHDRALLYYRLLQHDVHKASQILLRASNVDGPFLEEAPSELSDKIFEEVSSSSKQHCTASMSATDTPPIHPSLSLSAVQYPIGHLRRGGRALHHQREGQIRRREREQSGGRISGEWRWREWRCGDGRR